MLRERLSRNITVKFQISGSLLLTSLLLVAQRRTVKRPDEDNSLPSTALPSQGMSIELESNFSLLLSR